MGLAVVERDLEIAFELLGEAPGGEPAIQGGIDARGDLVGADLLAAGGDVGLAGDERRGFGGGEAANGLQDLYAGAHRAGGMPRGGRACEGGAGSGTGRAAVAGDRRLQAKTTL